MVLIKIEADNFGTITVQEQKRFYAKLHKIFTSKVMNHTEKWPLKTLEAYLINIFGLISKRFFFFFFFEIPAFDVQLMTVPLLIMQVSLYFSQHWTWFGQFGQFNLWFRQCFDFSRLNSLFSWAFSQQKIKIIGIINRSVEFESYFKT